MTDALANLLRPYQKRFIADRSRLQIVLKSRQIGMTTAIELDAVLEAVVRGRDVFFVSVNFNKAKSTVRGARKWLKALAVAAPELEADCTPVTDNKEYLELPGGARISALPCKERSVRGESGTVYLDEAAHYNDAKSIYAGIAPAIVSDPTLRLVLCSTPFGQKGLFYEVWSGDYDVADGHDLEWSRHKIDVHRAVEQGFPDDVLALRDSYPSDIWAQEFLCQFIVDDRLFFGLELIKSCFSDPATWPDRGRRYLAADVASVRDKSVWVELLESGDQIYLDDMGTLSDFDNPTSYPEQREALVNKIRAGNYERVGIDATGEGKPLADDLRHTFGRQVVPVKITHQWKDEIIPALKTKMESGDVHLPNVPQIRDSFGKIRTELTSANNLLYRADRDGDGHADEFYATAIGYSLLYQKPRPRRADDGQTVEAHSGVVESLASKYMGY